MVISIPKLGATGAALRFALVGAALLVTTFIAGGTASANPLAPPTPHSPNAEAAADAYWFMLAVFVILVIVVNALLVVALVRFRRRRGDVITPVVERPGRTGLLPVAGFAVLAIAILVMAAVTTTSARDIETDGTNALTADSTRFAQLGIGEVPPFVGTDGEVIDIDAPGATNQGVDLLGVSPVRIKAIGQRWLWRFEYPGNNPQGAPRFTYGELVVPVDTPVILEVTSVDVAHTWWIPSLGGQVQVFPGNVVPTWFKADEEGLFHGASTTFSGAAYPTMRAWVRAVPASEYRGFVEQLERDLIEAGNSVQELVGESDPADEETDIDLEVGGDS